MITWPSQTETFAPPYSSQPYLLLSASTGSIPGKLIVMADGAPTSYVLTGLVHSPILTKMLNTPVDRTLTEDLAYNINRATDDSATQSVTHVLVTMNGHVGPPGTKELL